MTFLKILWTDLVEKRLWPVAVALLLALVAVPVLLGGGSDEVVGPLGATGTTGADATLVAQVALDADTPERRDRLGKLRDPFKQPPAPKVPSTGATGAAGARATAADAAAGDAGAGAAGRTGAARGSTPSTGTTAPSPAPPTPNTTPPRPAEPRDAYTAVLRLGRKGAKRTARRFDRLTPLPSADNPYLVYLGVTETEEAVSFLLSTDVRATGDGKCLPNKTSCESIELRRGQSAELEVTSDDGRLTRWVLDLVRIDKTGKAAPSRAVAARDAS